MDPLKPLNDEKALEEALAAELAVVYKHSPRCWICRKAVGQVREFAEHHPDVPVFLLDVVEQGGLSRAAAERTGVEHQSPQIIVIRKGRAAWSGSHFRISTRILERETAGAN